jgi:hypothetical protein
MGRHQVVTTNSFKLWRFETLGYTCKRMHSSTIAGTSERSFRSLFSSSQSLLEYFAMAVTTVVGATIATIDDLSDAASRKG